MKLIKDSFDWQEYCNALDITGVAGIPYAFQHVNEPDEFPCVCETVLDDRPSTIELIHVFFTSEHAAMLSGLTVRGEPFEEEQ